MADTVSIRVEDFTVSELEELESIVGAEALDEMLGGKVRLKVLRPLVYIARKRTDPEFTLEAAGAVRLGDIEVKTDMDPTAAADTSNEPPSATSGD